MIKFSGQLVLASQSPRRQEILERMGVPFRVEVKAIDESFSSDMPAYNVPGFLAEQKALAFGDLSDDIVLLTADTVVIDPSGGILNKPSDVEEAMQMLQALSGTVHTVVTAFCIRTSVDCQVYSDTAQVTFRVLSQEEMKYYVTTCQPFDKAGGYGVQDFIGLAGVTHIEGSFYTIMGLPSHRVYEALQPWIQWN